MRRLFFIKKVPFSASALGLAAIVFSGFVTFRPNRIAVGKAVFLSQTLGNIWIAVAILWVVLFLVSALRIPGRMHLFFTGLLSSTLIFLLIATAAKHASLTAQDAGSIARTSLGPAFWTPLFALIVILAKVR